MTTATDVLRVPQYVNGRWAESSAAEWQDVVNPASGEVLARVPLADAVEVGAAVDAAAAAYPEWRRTPPEDRIQPLFKLKQLLEAHVDDLARIITQENGKTLTEARAELPRGIENVEVACGIPTLMQGYNLEDVARGIDEIMIRQPLGRGSGDHAVQFSGDDSVLVSALCDCVRQHAYPQTIRACAADLRAGMFELLDQTGLPQGRGESGERRQGCRRRAARPSRSPSDQLRRFHSGRTIYLRRAPDHGKRAQCQGGAKNHV